MMSSWKPRSMLLAVKIAAFFLVVMLIFVSGTLHLFAVMVMHPLAHGEAHINAAHSSFVVVVLLLALVAMALMTAFSAYITAPLRRMSRSMDRIAAGDLDHRVEVRGRDEGAAMGRSFNAMAERVRAMIVGQKELTAGVSHELRSPLTRMKLALELLREGKGSEERIADLEAEVDALDALVEELLLASRIDLGSVPLELETLELEDLCREAWTRVAAGAAAQGTELVVRVAEDARSVLADRSLAVRLFGNLFENSVRYAGAGRVTVVSERRADCVPLGGSKGGRDGVASQENRLQITVSDEGPGVEEADLDRLFEPFFRADRSRSRKTGAGGLGLMIVRRAVEAHGGHVLARRSKPRGLAVELDLPCPRNHDRSPSDQGQGSS